MVQEALMAWRVLRYDNLLHDITEGKMLGKVTCGRKRMELLHDMMEDYTFNHRQINLIASEKECPKPAGNSRRLKKKIMKCQVPLQHSTY